MKTNGVLLFEGDVHYYIENKDICRAIENAYAHFKDMEIPNISECLWHDSLCYRTEKYDIYVLECQRKMRFLVE